MKVLFIGGTGTISSAITKELAAKKHEIYLINRGNQQDRVPDDVKLLQGDINNEEWVSEVIKELSFDVVADFIAFSTSALERDYRLFKDKTKQFIFISSASSYQKPLSNYIVNESTPLHNPYWEYSREKIACEEYLLKQYREKDFPITIIRPSHTYSDYSIPLGVKGNKGSWQVVKRMLEGKPVIIHGDGTSLWTMTHNTDFANAFIGLMGNCHAIGESIQIMSDEVLTWNQIYKCIADALGVELKAVHVSSEFLANCSSYDFTGSLIGDKANSVVFDNSKLKKLVPHFVATTRFDQGIKKTVRYILRHPECQIEDPEFDKWCDKVVEVLEKAKKEIKESL